MKYKVILLMSVVFLFTSCFLVRIPILTTYSIKGEVTFINECNGEGADNPTKIPIRSELVYRGNTTVIKRTVVDMVLQPDGVTSKGTYIITDVPTNLIGKEWNLTFPNMCQYILCDPITSMCKQLGTNARMPLKIIQTTSVYNYRYACGCN